MLRRCMLLRAKAQRATVKIFIEARQARVRDMKRFDAARAMIVENIRRATTLFAACAPPMMMLRYA